jgi:hypothetical protein
LGKTSTKLLVLNRYEIATIKQILNMPNSHGSVADLRCTKSVIDLLAKEEGQQPDRPTPPKPEKKGEEVSKEAQTAYVNEVKEWSETVKKLAEEEVELTFQEVGLELVRKKVKDFPGFFNDESSRDRILTLADKLGI